MLNQVSTSNHLLYCTVPNTANLIFLVPKMSKICDNDKTVEFLFGGPIIIYSKTGLKDFDFKYSKPCLKRPLKNRQNKGINGKW